MWHFRVMYFESPLVWMLCKMQMKQFLQAVKFELY